MHVWVAAHIKALGPTVWVGMGVVVAVVVAVISDGQPGFINYTTDQRHIFQITWCWLYILYTNLVELNRLSQVI